MLITTEKLFAKALESLPELSWATEFTAEMAAFFLLLSFFGLAELEIRKPAIKWPARKLQASYRSNFGLFLVNNILMSLCAIASLYWIADHFAMSGLLDYVTNPGLKGLLAFLAIDLLLYVWHVICHKYDVLWQLHRVHHNDPYLNVSTAFRLHIIEMLLTHGLKALVIVALGIDKTLVLMIETLSTMCIMFHHANITFPFERQLGRFMIVPFLHRTHHSTERSEHDSNYGAVFSVWDYLFGTLLKTQPKAIGTKGDSPQDVLGLLKFGFGIHSHEPEYPAELEHMIAVAAYYRAERRNFLPGDDQRDWHEAKADIIARYYAATHPSMSVTSLIGRLLHNKWMHFTQRCKQQKFNCRFG